MYAIGERNNTRLRVRIHGALATPLNELLRPLLGMRKALPGKLYGRWPSLSNCPNVSHCFKIPNHCTNPNTHHIILSLVQNSVNSMQIKLHAPPNLTSLSGILDLTVQRAAESEPICKIAPLSVNCLLLAFLFQYAAATTHVCSRMLLLLSAQPHRQNPPRWRVGRVGAQK